MIKATWTAPTKHTSGRPVKPGELEGYSLRMKVEGAPEFTEIATPQSDETEFDVEVDDPGTYEFQLFAVGSNGTLSAPATGSVTITDDTALEAPVLTVSLA